MDKNNIFIEVIGDVNDGDYITKHTCIDDYSKKDIKKVLSSLEKLTGEYVYSNYEEEIDDILYHFLPSMDNQELHTIKYISIIEMKEISKEKLLDII